MTQIKITIPSPCQENWTAMTLAEKGRFCASCQKVVHDFTRSSDREIASVLSKDKQACGRFLNTQLDRNLVIPKEKKPIWMAASAAVVSFLALGTNEVIAQTPVHTEQQPQQLKEGTDQFKSVSGTVKDSTGYPLPGVSITNINNAAATLSDFDGNFTIKANKDDEIQFVFIGFENSKTRVNNNFLNIVMEETLNNEVLVIESLRRTTERCSVGAITTLSVEDIQDRAKRPTFFGRMLRKIDSLFHRKD